MWLSMCLEGCVRFERHCGKMYSRHHSSYGTYIRYDFQNFQRYGKMWFSKVVGDSCGPGTSSCIMLAGWITCHSRRLRQTITV